MKGRRLTWINDLAVHETNMRSSQSGIPQKCETLVLFDV